MLALVAGFVDALGYLLLAHLFTAHMSGNAAAIGAHAGQGNWTEVLLRALPVPAFVLGATLGAFAVTLARRRTIRLQFAPSFVLEIGLLVTFLLAWPHTSVPAEPGTWRFTGLVALLAGAMGIQAATLRRVGNERVNTTFVSGMLISTVESFVEWVVGKYDRADRIELKAQARHAMLCGAIFIAFLIGAVTGSAAERLWGASSLCAPIAVLALVAADDIWRRGRP